MLFEIRKCLCWIGINDNELDKMARWFPCIPSRKSDFNCLCLLSVAITHFDKFGTDFGEIIRTTNKQTNKQTDAKTTWGVRLSDKLKINDSCGLFRSFWYGMICIGRSGRFYLYFLYVI